MFGRGTVTMRLTIVLLSTAAAPALLFAATASAQTSTDQAAADQASPVTANAAVAGQADTTAAQADANDVGAGDIVVTATRRSERLSEVPISINAVSQAALQNSGATDIR